jgi:hypothetical protein
MNDNPHDPKVTWVRNALDAELTGLSGRPEALQQILDRADSGRRTSSERQQRGHGRPALRPRIPRWAVAAAAVAGVAVAVPLARSVYDDQPSGPGGSSYPPASNPSGTPEHEHPSPSPSHRRVVPAPAPSPSAFPSHTGSTTAHGAPRCDGPSLLVSVTGPEGAAGTIYRTVVFKNTSRLACYLSGFPGVTATNGVDTIDARRDTSWPVSKVILQSGSTAHADIAIGSVPQLPGPCPVYHKLLVTPPDSRRTSSFSASMAICSSKVLLTRPVQPGSRT